MEEEQEEPVLSEAELRVSNPRVQASMHNRNFTNIGCLMKLRCFPPL